MTQTSTRWVPTSYKWGYEPDKSGYNLSYPFIGPFIGLLFPFITRRGPRWTQFWSRSLVSWGVLLVAPEHRLSLQNKWHELRLQGAWRVFWEDEDFLYEMVRLQMVAFEHHCNLKHRMMGDINDEETEEHTTPDTDETGGKEAHNLRRKAI